MWDKYTDGELTDTKPKPHRIKDARGRTVLNPSTEQLNADGWFQQIYQHNGAEIVDTWAAPRVIDGRSVYEPETTRTHAEAEAARIGQLAKDYGQRIGQLGGLMALLEVPPGATEEEATAQIYATRKAKPELDADGDLLVRIYDQLREHMSHDDIIAVAALLRGAA